MNFQKNVDFELTKEEFETMRPLLGRLYGADLQPLEIHPYGSPPEHPDTKKRYRASLPEHYEMGATEEVTNFVVKA